MSLLRQAKVEIEQEFRYCERSRLLTLSAGIFLATALVDGLADKRDEGLSLTRRLTIKRLSLCVWMVLLNRS